MMMKIVYHNSERCECDALSRFPNFQTPSFGQAHLARLSDSIGCYYLNLWGHHPSSGHGPYLNEQRIHLEGVCNFQDNHVLVILARDDSDGSWELEIEEWYPFQLLVYLSKGQGG